MELVERKYSKYFKNLARKIKRNGYKRENMSKLKKGWSETGKIQDCHGDGEFQASRLSFFQFPRLRNLKKISFGTFLLPNCF